MIIARRVLWTALGVFGLQLGLPVAGAGAASSMCFAIAQAPSGVQLASLNDIATELPSVTIEYAGHSTFRISTEEGIVIATDYAGYAGEGRRPDVVTMNHAHSSHFTELPDPRISHVLRGWSEDGGAANHELRLKDVLIRNIPTDIRRFDGVEPFGNSIFVFEVAGLCIGHLGHLHHMPSEEHYARIGRLDVVMVPVDGTYTMDVHAMVKVLERLRTRLVLPMHYFGQATLDRFLSAMAPTYEIRYPTEDTLRLTLRDLPEKPTVMVLR